MYRINSLLSKHATQQSSKHVFNRCNAYKYPTGRPMSITPKRTPVKPIYVGLAAVAVVSGLVQGTIALRSLKNHPEFRSSVENTIPLSKMGLDYLLGPPEITSVEEIMEWSSDTVSEQEPIAVVEEEGTSDDNVLVLNLMDTPAASAIDLEVGSKVEHDLVSDVIDTIGEAIVETVEDEHVQEIIHDAEKEVLEEVVEDLTEIVVAVTPSEVATVIEALEEIAEYPAMSEAITKAEDAVIDYVEEKVVDFAASIMAPIEVPIEEAPTMVEEAVAEPEPVVTKEHLMTVLSNAYENLRIILDDTIISKTSAAGMLHGYITQYCQALMVSKEDSVYSSIWEAVEVLEQNITENIALVKVKEDEANIQIEKIGGLMQDVLVFGESDVANKVDTLLSTTKESLAWGELEIGNATQKLTLLKEFIKRVEGSPEKLKESLENFKGDMIKLLNSDKSVEVLNLPFEDALLSLSLQRPELIYAEVEKKELEQKLQFDSLLEEQKQNLLKEADENLLNVMQVFEANKNNELQLKITELNELHDNHLQEELKSLSAADQLEKEGALAVNEAELTAKHEQELSEKLNALGLEYEYIVSKNVSSLKGIQSKISDVVELSAQQQRSQNIWIAAQAISMALKEVSDSGRTISLLPSIANIKQFSADDEILGVIIESLPKDATDSGVVPEDGLVRHFSDVKRKCMRWAAVKDDSTLSYIFSYIKSFFVISKFYQKHVADDVDIETIGPYELLEKADYCIQHGDLAQAAKLLSLLKGAPKNLSGVWLNEARLFLETKQSIDLLMAYAASFCVVGNE